MNPETRVMIARAWRERRIAFAFCCGWMLICILYVVFYELVYPLRTPVARFYSTNFLYSMIAAVFIAMRTAFDERTQGTLNFSLAMPVSGRRLGTFKLAAGWATLVVPIVLGALLMTPIVLSGFLEQAPVRPTTSYLSLTDRPSLSAFAATHLLWTVTAVSIASGTGLLVILAVIGMQFRSESQIGYLGAVLALSWLILTGISVSYPSLSGWFGALFPVSLIVNYGYGGETGNYTDLDVVQPLFAQLLVNAVLLLVLAKWFVRHYGTSLSKQTTMKPAWWRRTPAILSYVAVPLPSRLAALIWINLRQSLPIVVPGLLLAALIAMLQLSSAPSGQEFRSQLPSSTWFVATLWAIIVGVGVFASELQPKLSDFWRSRPISTTTWFWTKFLIGLLAVLFVLDGVTIMVSWGTPIGRTEGMPWSYIACMPILHATTYGIAVLAMIWIRKPVVAGVLTIVVFGITMTLLDLPGIQLGPIDVYNQLLDDEMAGGINLMSHNYPVVYGSMIAIMIACGMIASRKIRSES